MKIGILTYHAASNFGANLQAYASVCIYRQAGHEPIVINYIRPTDRRYLNSVNTRQYYAHHEFLIESLPLTREVSSPDELLKMASEENFDLISIGADAVWRAPLNDNDLVFFADWLINSSLTTPVVAMSAAHMGDGFKSIPASFKYRVKNNLKKFSFIAVRDQWTQQKINEDIFGDKYIKNINPDPVIWLSDFVGDIDTPYKAELSRQPYYLMTLPVRCDAEQKTKKWFAEFKSLVNESGYSLAELPLPEGISGLDFDVTIKYPINPLHWFSYISHSKAFCGLRFHAIMSSISSGTPFFSIDSYGNNSFWLRIAQVAGFYKIRRAFDSRSKIRNLLLGSGFEDYRVSASIVQISPQKVFNMLENFDREKLIVFRDSLRGIYSANLESMLKSLKHEN